MRSGSIRLRTTGLVTLSFALLLIIAGVIFVRWFDGRLVSEVRADDMAELDRQLEVLGVFEEIGAMIPGFVVADDINNPAPDLAEEFPLALIPDDGTVISILNSNGDLIINSDQSLATMLNADTALEPGSDLTMTEIQDALNNMPTFLTQLRADLPQATLDEYAVELDFLDESFPALDEPIEEEFIDVQVELTDMATELFFGRGDRSANEEGRQVVTVIDTDYFGETPTLRAESRVTNIDAAVSAVTTTLLWVIPLLTALVATLTYLATGRALRPVEAITEQVEQIRSARTGERVPVPDSNDEINHLASTMNNMLDRLEASAVSQRRFVSDVSHELRTPAAVIRAEIEAALVDPANDWTATGESVLGEQERLSDLVDDLLLLARIDEGDESSRSDVDLDEVLQSEAARGWPRPTDTVGVEPVRIEGNRRQLGRALQNLVSNAHRHAATSVSVSSHLEGDVAVVRVDDDGNGIPATSRDQVFERFTRLDEARVRDGGGSGLGLAIVREVAEAHGGTATATNSPLGGARVELRLPITGS